MEHCGPAGRASGRRALHPPFSLPPVFRIAQPNPRFNQTRCARWLTSTLGPCPYLRSLAHASSPALRGASDLPRGRPSVLAAVQLSRAVRCAAFPSHSCSAIAAFTLQYTPVLLRPAFWANTSAAKGLRILAAFRRTPKELLFPSPVPYTLPLGNPASWHSIALPSLAAMPVGAANTAQA